MPSTAPEQGEDTGRNAAPSSTAPCTWRRTEAECAECAIQDRLMCHYASKDLVRFFMNALPLFVTVIGGMVRGGYAWGIWIWLVYSLLFFFGWEARVLCSHCPMWAEESRVLHCHANNGVIKLWRYRPGPMSRWERVQFIVGALIWLAIPLAFVAMGGEILLLVIGVASSASAIYGLRHTACRECLNFSCPLNAVSKDIVDEYLRRSPAMREAWEESGYVLGVPDDE